MDPRPEYTVAELVRERCEALVKAFFPQSPQYMYDGMMRSAQLIMQGNAERVSLEQMRTPIAKMRQHVVAYGHQNQVPEHQRIEQARLIMAALVLMAPGSGMHDDAIKENPEMLGLLAKALAMGRTGMQPPVYRPQ